MVQGVFADPRPNHYCDLRNILIETGLAFARTRGSSVLGLPRPAVRQRFPRLPRTATSQIGALLSLLWPVARKVAWPVACITKMHPPTSGNNPSALSIAKTCEVGLADISFVGTKPGRCFATLPPKRHHCETDCAEAS